MKLTVKIKKLFESFNYDLVFDKQISILTSPNGFGKTTILKMLYFLYIKNFNRLIEVEFSELEITINSDIFIVEKTLIGNEYCLSCSCNNEHILKFTKQDFENRARALGYIRSPQAGNQWTMVQWLHLGFQVPIIQESQIRNVVYSQDNKIKAFWDKLPKILFISANRLIEYDDDGKITNPHSPQYIDRINDRFRQLIHTTLQEYSNESQIVDSKFMNQLINFNPASLKKTDYQNKIKLIKEKSALISKYRLLSHVDEKSIPTYNSKHKEVFTIYVTNWLNKLSKFDALVNKFELFTNIINKKKLVNKKIIISMQDNIAVQRNDGKPLPLQYLSHGEQHLLILLYELLFNSSNYDLVLIDEPEIGLHISWQLEFIEDLKKILEIANVSSIVATHSPQIINDKWDYVFDLSKFYDKK